MKQIFVNRFDGGMGESRYNRTVGQSAVCKHFDITSFPFRAVPYPGVVADITGQSGVGNLQIGSDGNVWGLGIDGSSFGEVYKKTGVANNWTTLSNGNAGAAIAYTFFTEYRGRWYFARSAVGRVFTVQLADGEAAANHDISGATFRAALAHTKDDILYIAYTTSSGAFIATRNGATWNDTAFTGLPTSFTPTSLSEYGNYLAIGGFIGAKSIVYLWDRDTSLNTLSETIDWGQGKIQVLNQLDGVLIGISSNYGIGGDTPLERASVLVQAYDGAGSAGVTLLKEIITDKYDTSSPSVTINDRVNFIYGHKLYFSINVVASVSYVGVWTITRSPLSGRWTVTIEHMGTNNSSETGVLAACRSQDYFYIVHDSVGTIKRTINSSVIATAYTATSVIETVVNPGMPENDYQQRKKLMAVSLHTSPLTSAGQVVLKYRVDSTGSFTTIFTKTNASPTANLTAYRQVNAGTTGPFQDGHHYEFRIESTGGAEITGLSYEYEQTNPY